MSEEQQDAIIGNLVRRKGEAERKIVALKAEAQRLGEQLSSIGDKLQKNPHFLFFSTDGGIVHTSSPMQMVVRDVPDIAKLKTLIDDYRSTLQSREAIDRELRVYGL